MPFYFDAFTLVIAREHPSCTAPLFFTLSARVLLNVSTPEWKQFTMQRLLICLFCSLPELRAEQLNKRANRHGHTTHKIRTTFALNMASAQYPACVKNCMGHDKVSFPKKNRRRSRGILFNVSRGQLCDVFVPAILLNLIAKGVLALLRAWRKIGFEKLLTN